MSENNKFIKNLVLHIRYPWTALCIFIMWVGLAIVCGMVTVNHIEMVICLAGVATVITAIIGFGK